MILLRTARLTFQFTILPTTIFGMSTNPSTVRDRFMSNSSNQCLCLHFQWIFILTLHFTSLVQDPVSKLSPACVFYTYTPTSILTAPNIFNTQRDAAYHNYRKPHNHSNRLLSTDKHRSTPLCHTRMRPYQTATLFQWIGTIHSSMNTSHFKEQLEPHLTLQNWFPALPGPPKGEPKTFSTSSPPPAKQTAKYYCNNALNFHSQPELLKLETRTHSLRPLSSRPASHGSGFGVLPYHPAYFLTMPFLVNSQRPPQSI